MRDWIRLVRSEIAPLGSASALSLRVSLIFIPIGLASQVFTDAAVNGGPIGLWFVASLAGMGVLIAAMALARLLLANGRTPKPAEVLLAFAVAGVARSIVVRAVALQLGLSAEAHLAYRLAGGLVYTPALLGVTAFAICRLDAHRSLVAQLESTRQALLTVEQSAEADLECTTRQLSEAAKESLQPAVENVSRALIDAERGTSVRPALSALLSMVDEQVRPMSHSLANGIVVGATVPVPTKAGAVRLPLPRRLPLRDGIKPMLAALLFVAASTPSALRDYPVLQALPFLAASLLYPLALLTAARRTIGRFELPSAVATAAVVALHAAVGNSTIRLSSLFGIPTPRGITGTGTVIAALVGTMTVVTALVDARRAATESELRTVVERLQETVDLVRRRERLARRRLAHVLHGSLQGALHAAAMRLSETETPDPKLLESVRGEIGAALQKLEPEEPAGSRGLLTETLAELAGAWGDRRQIKAVVEAAAANRLALDSEADEVAALLVREAVTNSLRHGKARVVDIFLSLDAQPNGEDCLSLLVRDNGSGWATDSSMGLGTALFDELCREWRHDSDESGTTLVALITLS